MLTLFGYGLLDLAHTFARSRPALGWEKVYLCFTRDWVVLDTDVQYVVLQIHYDNPSLRTDFEDSSGVRMKMTANLRKYDVGCVSNSFPHGFLLTRSHSLQDLGDGDRSRVN